MLHIKLGLMILFDFKGMNVGTYNGDFTVVRTDTARRFTISINQLSTN